MVGFPRDRLSRLALGTAQLGMDYGVVAPSRAPDDSAARAILDAAWESGITCFDTARLYGDAESRIGAWRAATGHAPLVITKFAKRDDAAAVEGDLAASMAALGVTCLDGVLAHGAEYLHMPGVAAALREAVDTGRLGAFGASVYDPDAAARALAVPGVTLLQAPLSAFDRRLVESGALERAAAGGVAVFARGVFLQGLLLSDPDRLSAFFEPAAPALRRFQAIAGAAGLSPAALALASVLAEDGVASVVIGVADADQMRANAQAAGQGVDPAAIDEARAAGRDLPVAMIDPRQWPT